MAALSLVVDDSLFMRRMLIRILEGLGCEVIGEAGDGDEAVAKYLQFKPDLITLDLIMPNMDGLEALKRVRAMDRDVKVIVVSALDQRQCLLEAMRLGADDYVVKPFDAACVESAVNRAMAATA